LSTKISFSTSDSDDSRDVDFPSMSVTYGSFSFFSFLTFSVSLLRRLLLEQRLLQFGLHLGGLIGELFESRVQPHALQSKVLLACSQSVLQIVILLAHYFEPCIGSVEGILAV